MKFSPSSSLQLDLRMKMMRMMMRMMRKIMMMMLMMMVMNTWNCGWKSRTRRRQAVLIVRLEFAFKYFSLFGAGKTFLIWREILDFF